MAVSIGGALGAALLAASLTICGCAGGLRQLQREGLPSRGSVEGLIPVVQTEGGCGPAALSVVLGWAGKPEAAETLLPLVYVPRRAGTLPIDLAREARARGLLAYRPAGAVSAILPEVAAGHPVLVLENRGLSFAPLWHYSVLAGYDLEEGRVLLYAGAAEPERVRFSTFSRTWLRGGGVALLVLPPPKLPAAGDPERILSAVADLEEAGKPQAAARFYEGFLQRWPESWKGAFGRANSLYAAGDFPGSEEALRRAHANAPERPEPLNNLALLLLARGQWAEASAFAEEALEKARTLGLAVATYEETLQEVRRAPRDER
jgi:tetratricopeptide (TPR) repeat protein